MVENKLLGSNLNTATEYTSLSFKETNEFLLDQNDEVGVFVFILFN